MGPDHGAVEDEPLQIRVLQRLEYPEPHTLAGPAVEPPPGGVPVPEALGEVAPGGTGLGDPEDGVHEMTVVGGRDAGVAGPAGEEAVYPHPVFIRQLVATHGWMLGGCDAVSPIALVTLTP